MGKTFRKEANPERVARVQELRRSSAAGPTNRKRTKRAEREEAIMDSFDDELAMNDEDRIEDMWDDGYDEYGDCS